MCSYPGKCAPARLALGRRRVLADSMALPANSVAGHSRGHAGQGGEHHWEFVDDLGVKIVRDRRPKRVAGYVTTAAGLWDFGIRPIAVFGPQRSVMGAKEIQTGNIDLDTVESVGHEWDDLDIDKLASLKPDLVVTGFFGPRPTDPRAIPKATGELVAQIAPIAAIGEYQISLPKVIENYARLAAALGANLGTAKIASDRAAFERASEELRRVAREKAGLTVLAMYARAEDVYIAKPAFFGDLAYYQELGVNLVSGRGALDHWERVTWQRLGEYRADLILTDVRAYATRPDQMGADPRWRDLPAVRAGQVGEWSAEPWSNYALATPVIRALADLMRRSRVDVVS